jgi:hypothetical protein
MEGAGHVNIYAWWADVPVVIFSAWGFDQLLPEGAETDRVIANALVEMLAGYLGQLEPHKRRTNCPLFFNQRRDFAHLSGALQFDARCRAQLAKTPRANLAALETLLRTFERMQRD